MQSSYEKSSELNREAQHLNRKANQKALETSHDVSETQQKAKNVMKDAADYARDSSNDIIEEVQHGWNELKHQTRDTLGNLENKARKTLDSYSQQRGQTTARHPADVRDNGMSLALVEGIAITMLGFFSFVFPRFFFVGATVSPKVLSESLTVCIRVLASVLTSWGSALLIRGTRIVDVKKGYIISHAILFAMLVFSTTGIPIRLPFVWILTAVPAAAATIGVFSWRNSM